MESGGCEIKGNQNITTQYALRVALQTMKERCLCQQKRLAEMEEENQRLRQRLTSEQQTNMANVQQHINGSGIAENFQLRLQVTELQQQKEQLNAHINMVSNENRKLWSRLSQITKGQATSSKENTSPLFNEHCPSGNALGLSVVHQNLIRSKTFTQHSPNPNLRHKLMASDATEEDNMVVLQAVGEGKSDLDMTGSDYAYLNAEEYADKPANAQDQDFSTEAKKCIDGLQEIRREAMKQHQDLNSLIALLENRATRSADDCVCGKWEKPEMTDKSLETDIHPEDNCSIRESYEALLDGLLVDNLDNGNNYAAAMNFANGKFQTDDGSKICPMCGAAFDSQVTFELFCEHVEEHFCDDSVDLEHSSERNFEMVSATMGDF